MWFSSGMIFLWAVEMYASSSFGSANHLSVSIGMCMRCILKKFTTISSVRKNSSLLMQNICHLLIILCLLSNLCDLFYSLVVNEMIRSNNFFYGLCYTTITSGLLWVRYRCRFIPHVPKKNFYFHSNIETEWVLFLSAFLVISKLT